jgi:hypothetical protein
MSTDTTSVGIPQNSAEASALLRKDVSRLKDKARLLSEGKIPLEEYFKDLALHEQFYCTLLDGMVEEQLQRVELWKQLSERVQSISTRIRGARK